MKCNKCKKEMDIIEMPIGTGSGPALFGCQKCSEVKYTYIEAIPI